MNPNTNRFEQLVPQALEDEVEKLKATLAGQSPLVRPDGSPVPETWSTFSQGEQVVIKGYTFRVAYIGETAILFEPVGPEHLTTGAPTK